MEKMSEEDKKFSWDDVSTIVYGVVLALFCAYRRMADPPLWLPVLVALFFLCGCIKDIVLYFKQKDRSKRRFWFLIISVFGFLCCILMLLNAFGLLGE